MATTISLPSTQADASDLHFLFPIEGHEADLRSVALGLEQTLGFKAAYWMGFELVTLEDWTETGPGEVRLTIREGDEPPWQLTQRFIGKDPGASYFVAPQDVHPGVEAYSSSLFRVMLPFGQYGPADDPKDVADEIATRVGLPTRVEWDLTPFETHTFQIMGSFIGTGFPRLYLGCEDCFMLTQHAPRQTSTLNRLAIAFTPQGEAVGIELSAWVDLERSDILTAAQAHQVLVEALADVGVRSEHLTLRSSHLEFEEPRVHYNWAIRSVPGISGAVQDAHTGHVLRVEEAHTQKAPPSRDAPQNNDVPIPSLTALAAIALAVAIARRPA